MHPAPSIILFTTLSGLGYGLAIVLGLGVLDAGATATRLAHLVALALISAGLLSSTLHLGNPKRAWRAFSQWRSSWLSREGVLAMLSFLPLTAAAALSLFAGQSVWIIGVLGSALSVLTVICTAMIYASLRAVPLWNTLLTPLCYLLLSLAGGLSLATLFSAAQGLDHLVPAAAVAAIGAAWAAKLVWWRRVEGLPRTSTPETATGLGSIGRVRLFERPHVMDNYLTREMGYRVARKHAAKLRILALAIGAGLPMLLHLAMAVSAMNGAVAVGTAAVAFCAVTLGILAERWLFFAEARHAVMNYY